MVFKCFFLRRRIEREMEKNSVKASRPFSYGNRVKYPVKDVAVKRPEK